MYAAVSSERSEQKWKKKKIYNNAKSKKVWAGQEREKRDWENSPSALFGMEQIKYLINSPVMRKHSNYYYYSMHSRSFVAAADDALAFADKNGSA